jgi:hypothetical protein
MQLSALLKRGQSWDDGVVRPLAWGGSVGVATVKAEVVAAVVKGEAAVLLLGWWSVKGSCCQRWLGLLS